MTKDEINRAVAEKVMGFRQIEGWAKWWFPAKESVTLDDAILDWNPAERIDHAMIALEKYKSKCRQVVLEWKKDVGWTTNIQTSEGRWYAIGPMPEPHNSIAWTLASALEGEENRVIAALKAKEGENE